MKLKAEKGFTIKEMQAYLANPENPMLPSYTKEVKDIRNLLENMQKMIGFRNIAIHDYKQIDEDVLADVIQNHLTDLIDFAKQILNLER